MDRTRPQAAMRGAFAAAAVSEACRLRTHLNHFATISTYPPSASTSRIRRTVRSPPSPKSGVSAVYSGKPRQPWGDI